jgi:branched-chain amino acid transport system substrate-binding protein
MVKRTRGEPDIDVQVFEDGSTAPSGDGGGVSLPETLTDLALGLLHEDDTHVEFIWTADESNACWSVIITKGVFRRTSSARVRAWKCAELPFGISKRELDVVTLVAAGMSNAAISEALVLSTRTVTTHIDHVMRKLDVSNRAAIAALALDSGIVGFPFPHAAQTFAELRVGRMARSAGRRRPVRVLPEERQVGERPIVVGAVVPLSGRGGADGLEMVNGATLAIEEINRRGGIHGRELRLQFCDADVDDRSSVQRAAQQLLAGRVDVITSGYLTHQTAAIDVASAEGVPFMHSSASSTVQSMVAANPRRYRNVFQFCPSDENYAPNYVRFVTALRDSGQWVPVSRRLVIMHQSAWTIVDFGLVEARLRAAGHGWELMAIAVEDTDDDGSRWGQAASSLNRLQPAAVMIGSYFVADHKRFIDRVRAECLRALLYSIYAPSIPEFRRRLRANSEGVVWATTTGTYSDRMGQEFAARYRQRFGVDPGRSHAGISYDRINILT